MPILAVIRTLWRSVAPRTKSEVEEEFCSTLAGYQENLIRQGPPCQWKVMWQGARFCTRSKDHIAAALRAMRMKPFSAASLLKISSLAREAEFPACSCMLSDWRRASS